jgi:hypothetical protein
LSEEGEDDLSGLRRGGEGEGPIGLYQAEMALVPPIQSFWIIGSDKRAAKAGD